MKPGTTIRKFKAKDGRKVTLRAPRWSDLDDMLFFINSLVEEGAEIAADTKKTKDQEVEWLARLLSSVERDKKVSVVADVGGRFVGHVEAEPRGGRSRHVGVLGIALLEGYREIGIGTEMVKEAEVQAKRLGIEIMTLEVYATNERARHVYTKLGYREAGCVPRAAKKDGDYLDIITMTKENII